MWWTEERWYSGAEVNRMVGQYVRMVFAPKTRMGTITETRTRNGRTEYLFQHDTRFDDVLSNLWLLESEIEVCARPTDAEVEAINELSRRGS